MGLTSSSRTGTWDPMISSTPRHRPGLHRQGRAREVLQRRRRQELRSPGLSPGIAQAGAPDQAVELAPGAGKGKPPRVDLSAAEHILGYKPRYSLEKGLADYMEVVRRHGFWH